MTPKEARDLIRWLGNPAKSLPVLGQVHDQETSQFVQFDSRRLTNYLQQDILDYFDDAPRTVDGLRMFMTILAGRQMGKSLVPEYCGYVKAAYNPGFDWVCIADVQDRADYLHKRVHHLHERWREDVRTPTVATRESRQLSFDSTVGGKMRVLSAANGAVGIGQSPDGFHACLAAGTGVLTPGGGVIPIEKIRPGDAVRTHSGAVAPVKTLWNRTKACWDVRIKGFSDVLRVTPEHKFWTREGKKELREVVERGLKIGYPVRRFSGVGSRSEAFRIEGAVRTHGGGSSGVIGPERIELTPSLGLVLGLYLAEGTVVYQHKFPHEPSAVSFAVHADEVDRTEAWIDRLGGLFTSRSTRANKGSLTRIVTVYGKSFAAFVARMMGTGAEKSFPAEFTEFPIEFIRAMAEGYMAGDGHCSNRRVSVSSIRPALVVGLRDICASLGYGWASIRRADSGVRYGRNCKEAWTFELCGDGAEEIAGSVGWPCASRVVAKRATPWAISDGFVWLPIEKIKEVGDVPVYDLEVDHPDHTYCLISAAVSNSECAFWADFAESMFLINPSLNNRAEALAIFECTPWEAGCDWHEHCLAAKAGEGRHFYRFYPFWDGKLNRRLWREEWNLDSEEERLLEKYGAAGLTLEGLAFRRVIMSSDAELRKDPEKFKVFYPFDDIDCWILRGRSIIPMDAIQRHKDGVLLPGREGYHEFLSPDQRGVYVIGADPCGQAARDHAAFQVLDLREDWSQAARFADHVDPRAFARRLFDTGKRYNNALIVVESNGVGQATLSHLLEWGYPRLYWHAKGKAGMPTTGASIDRMTGHLIEALMDDLTLYDGMTVEQLMTYKGDKRIEESPGLEAVRGMASNRRRMRHHWDNVSALMMAVEAARLERRRGPSRASTRITEPAFAQVTVADRAREWRNRLKHDKEFARAVRQADRRGRR